MIIFMHLIKTGGSTICEHIAKELPDQFIDQDAGIACERKKCKFLAGHRTGYGIHKSLGFNDAKYMTIVRDPADWYVSVYHHQMARDGVKKPITFSKWYAKTASNSVNAFKHVDNKMFRWFVSSFTGGHDISSAKAVLKACWFVGTTGQLNQDFPLICRELGISEEFVNERVTGKYDKEDKVTIKELYTLTDRMRNRIYEENPLDVEFYLYACKRRTETIQAIRGNHA